MQTLSCSAFLFFVFLWMCFVRHVHTSNAILSSSKVCMLLKCFQKCLVIFGATLLPICRHIHSYLQPFWLQPLTCCCFHFTHLPFEQFTPANVWILVVAKFCSFVRRWTQSVHVECVIKHLVWNGVFRILIYVFCHSLF